MRYKICFIVPDATIIGPSNKEHNAPVVKRHRSAIITEQTFLLEVCNETVSN